MSYFSLCLIANAKRFLGNFKEAERDLTDAEMFCPDRNEHLVFLTELYEIIEEYEKMHQKISFIIENKRNNPFPRWRFIIYTTCYPDTGDYVLELYNRAILKTGRSIISKSPTFPGLI